jgi:hypothetical protein
VGLGGDIRFADQLVRSSFPYPVRPQNFLFFHTLVSASRLPYEFSKSPDHHQESLSRFPCVLISPFLACVQTRTRVCEYGVCGLCAQVVPDQKKMVLVVSVSRA